MVKAVTSHISRTCRVITVYFQIDNCKLALLNVYLPSISPRTVKKSKVPNMWAVATIDIYTSFDEEHLFQSFSSPSFMLHPFAVILILLIIALFLKSYLMSA